MHDIIRGRSSPGHIITFYERLFFLEVEPQGLCLP